MAHRIFLIVACAVLLQGSACRDRFAQASAAEDTPRVLVTFTDEDASRSASVRVWSTRRFDDAALLFGSPNSSATQEVRALERVVGKRYVYAFELKGLAPATTYSLSLENGGQALGVERSFRTLADDDRPLRIVTGGDLYIDEPARRLLAQAAALSPDVVALGGDLAYENGKLAKAGRWDTLMRYLDEELVRADGTRIPVIAAVGNHEVRGGFAAGSPAKAPFWHALFSPLEGPDALGETYFRRQLGERVALFVLDTGHVVPHGGEQAAWLERALGDEQSEVRFALYHVPLFPSVRPFAGKWSVPGRESWLPLFDRFSLTAAFESHDHALKRTAPLKGGVPAEGGTVYLGDGAMGVPNVRRPDPDRPYLVSSAAAHHVWLVEVDAREIRLSAVTADGAVLDETTLPLKGGEPASAPPATVPPSEVTP